MKRFFQKRFGCYGLTLPLGRRTQVELWFAPCDSVIPMHTHPHIESHLMFLGGAMTWELSWPHGDLVKVGHRKRMGWRQLFRSFRVAPNCEHGAKTTGWFGLFANFERWLPGATMTSAAVDLQLVALREDEDEPLFGNVPTRPAADPVKDWLSAKVIQLTRNSPVCNRLRGPLACPQCGLVALPNHYYRLPDGTTLAPLAPHLVQCHREETKSGDRKHVLKLMGVVAA